LHPHHGTNSTATRNARTRKKTNVTKKYCLLQHRLLQQKQNKKANTKENNIRKKRPMQQRKITYCNNKNDTATTETKGLIQTYNIRKKE